MIRLRRRTAEGSAGGTPAPRRLTALRPRRLALAGLAMVLIGLDGCASDPCNGCGGLGAGLAGIGNSVGGAFRRAGDGVRGATNRVFHHKKRGCSDCGDGGVVEGMPIEGAPVMVPNTSSGGAIITTPPGGSGMSQEPDPMLLSPLPPGSGTGGSTGQKSSAVTPSGARSPTGRQSTSARPRSIEIEAPGRGENIAQAALIPPAGTTPASGSAGKMLDSLPRVDELPDEVVRTSRRPAVPAEAEQVKPTGGEGLAARPDPAVSRPLAPITMTPGLRRFSAVKPQIAGGSLPDPIGLDWLKEKGIKTLLDLRPTGEVDKAFVAQVKARGFTYIALPINIGSLDAGALAIFGDEIAQSDLQPIYFFDGDGTRAGLVWYIHRLSVDKVDGQLASREAEELGLAPTDRVTWQAAARFLEPTPPAKVDAPKADKAKVPPTIKTSATRSTGAVSTS